ncbi:hypothetical protein IFM89_031808 [Coptis chinensis]|uniref:Uncharacterized protein n=1 Tax=Coptis chinensis TaxID=261450 RepID=A0A835HRA2_9MAGN|nr:hypothetical protein IFM89_031808 [Coptis chinensis]
MRLTLLLLHFVTQIYADSINGCPQKCGSIEIPFPFGLAEHCSLSAGYRIFCKQSRQPTPYVYGTQHQVLSITNGELRINSTPYIARECLQGTQNATHITLPENSPFTISDISNTFTAIGCDMVAVITDDKSFTSGCVSLCAAQNSVANGTCSGAGCCESAIPKGKKYLGLGTSNMFGFKNVSGFNNCSYAFVVEKGGFIFVEHYLRDFYRTTDISMTLDWSIGNISCSSINSNLCGENSVCIDSLRGTGYLCICADGYTGNPYMRDSKGCQDIDECRDLEHNACVHAARCVNKAPGYRCICPFGSTGDGLAHGSGCKSIYLVIEAVLGTGLGFGIVLLWGLLFYSALKKRTLIKLKEQYFRQNGGILLKQQVSSRESGTGSARIFSLEELKLATQNYSRSRIIGTGGYGTVYKGVLDDGSVVAIKRSKVMDQSQINQFINEFIILTQINHRYVVKLLGCCLETEVPTLVYEFISNGTLHEHIHNKFFGTPISWSDRLRIAVETAEALSYLHSAASMPIFHRDVKSSNILLDEHYTAKVADFGISRLVPLNETQIPTLVQGTLGYLDPEYFQTSQLTEKSDVYSFGVVLVELLTGQKPVSFERSQEERNLAMYFLYSMKTKDLNEFLDNNVFREGSINDLRAVSELARKCLLLRGDKRPTMKEVAQELALIAGSGKQNHIREEEEEYDTLSLYEADESFREDLTITSDIAK